MSIALFMDVCTVDASVSQKVYVQLIHELIEKTIETVNHDSWYTPKKTTTVLHRCNLLEQASKNSISNQSATSRLFTVVD